MRRRPELAARRISPEGGLERMFPVSRAAEFWGVSRRQVKRWCKEGVIRYRRTLSGTGNEAYRRIVIPESEVQRVTSLMTEVTPKELVRSLFLLTGDAELALRVHKRSRSHLKELGLAVWP